MNTEEENISSWRDVGDICKRWTFGHLDWSRPRRITVNTEEENISSRSRETSVRDGLLGTWTGLAPGDLEEQWTW